MAPANPIPLRTTVKAAPQLEFRALPEEAAATNSGRTPLTNATESGHRANRAINGQRDNPAIRVAPPPTTIAMAMLRKAAEPIGSRYGFQAGFMTSINYNKRF